MSNVQVEYASDFLTQWHEGHNVCRNKSEVILNVIEKIGELNVDKNRKTNKLYIIFMPERIEPEKGIGTTDGG